MKDLILNLLETYNVKNIKVAGDEIRCCCPFHEEKKPSFSINLETGKYICFSGKCGKKGNLISFISELTGKKYNDVEQELQINFENLLTSVGAIDKIIFKTVFFKVSFSQ